MHRRTAFTLVELLVVMGIVALLIGLLVPALHGAGTSSRSLKCRSNLRQLFVMADTYAIRSDGRYPVGVRYERIESEFTIIAWDWQHRGDEVSLGPLWRNVIEPGEVQQCPECLSCSATFPNDPYTGYNYNTTYIAGEATFPRTGWPAVRHGIPMSQWRRTATTAIFGDGGWKGGANKFMRAPMNTIERNLQTVYAGGQAFRHGGKTNVCYLDGHTGAAGIPHKGLLATDQLLRDIMQYPTNGFLSDDDSAYDPR